VIKEFYPLDLAAFISRNGTCLYTNEDKRAVLNAHKNQFVTAAKNTAAFYGDDSNHTLPPAIIGYSNNTVYTAVPLTQGVTLKNAPRGLGINEISQIMLSICNAIAKLHNQEKLYLDIKPDNVFLFDKEQGETRRIALFDFDTVASIKDLAGLPIPFSQGWSPPEQEYQRNDEICYATDIYSIGALFYWLVSGTKASGDVLTDFEYEDFSCLDNCVCLRGLNNARNQTQVILSSVLRRSVSERTQSITELIKMFADLKDLSEMGGALSDKQDVTNAKLDLLLQQTSCEESERQKPDGIIKKTLKEAGFDGIFNEVEHGQLLDLVNRSELRMFRLNLVDYKFALDDMHRFLYKNLGGYVFSRARIDKFIKDDEDFTIVAQAINLLRETLSKDADSGNEFGDILLYVLIEKLLDAPKLFSKIELVGGSAITNAGSVHLLSTESSGGNPNYQMVWGKSHIVGDIKTAIDEAFDKMAAVKSGLSKMMNQIDTTLLSQAYDRETAETLSDIIIPRKKKSPTNNAFSVFLGYTLNVNPERHTPEEFESLLQERMTEDIRQNLGYIKDKISGCGMEMHSFYIYVIPLNDAVNDKQTVINALLDGRNAI
jgi:serine/threonine protein kinase